MGVSGAVFGEFVDFARRMLEFFAFRTEEVQTDHGTEFTYIFMPSLCEAPSL